MTITRIDKYTQPPIPAAVAAHQILPPFHSHTQLPTPQSPFANISPVALAAANNAAAGAGAAGGGGAPPSPFTKAKASVPASSPILGVKNLVMSPPTDDLRDLNIGGFEPKMVPGMISRAARKSSMSVKDGDSTVGGSQAGGPPGGGKVRDSENERKGKEVVNSGDRKGRPGMQTDRTWDPSAEAEPAAGLDEWA